jgi:hypothetical protein
MEQDPNLNCMDRENECNECAPEHRKYEGISKAQVRPKKKEK